MRACSAADGSRTDRSGGGVYDREIGLTLPRKGAAVWMLFVPSINGVSHHRTEDSANHSAIIDAMTSSQQRFNPPPFRIAEPVIELQRRLAKYFAAASTQGSNTSS